MLKSFFDKSKQSTAPKDDAPLFSSADMLARRRAEAWLADRIDKSQSGVFSEVVALTPVLAELLLSKNPDNRNIHQSKVDSFATDIKEGNWPLNGEPIIVSRCGLLNDGQHRCCAVVRTGRSIDVVVTFGLARSTRTTLDQGSTRSPGDYLAMEGYSSANQGAAVAALLYQYNRLRRVSYQTMERPTKAQVLEVYRANAAGIDKSVKIAHRKGCNLVGGSSVLAFCHFLFSKHNAEAADAFILSLIKGANLAEKDPIFLCRERLAGSKRMKVDEKVELIIRAWNHHRSGRRLQKIQLSSREPRRPNELPEVER